VDTFVHELVHVKQYGDVGPFEFLTDYFGEIGLEELKALLRGEKLDPFEASAFEKEAYALGRRFKRWRESVGR
ncbi:MAG: hypothetical protein QOE53_3041, partial [Pseudonocardiales bacterium]|nr:hypothetical protein [Pseudonocardiales bacterium]